MRQMRVLIIVQMGKSRQSGLSMIVVIRLIRMDVKMRGKMIVRGQRRKV